MSDRTTVVSLLRERASRQPDRTAYTFLANGETPENTLTYRQLDGKARAIASHLESGIYPGEKILQEVQVELERSHSRLSQIKAFLE
ncbi:MAG: hypothetical protein Fur0025_26850 [Oscillatoriaceae cyanobacterium]